MGSAIIAWSIRLSLLLFFGVLIVWVFKANSTIRKWRLNVLWTAGFVLFVAHVIAAFHFHHHWSHKSAVDETARQTQALIGLEFGGGVYFNYAFLVLWAVDLIWIWSVDACVRRRYYWLRATWLAYLVFIAFNGTVIFKGGLIRASGLAASALLAIGLAFCFRNRTLIMQPTSPSIATRSSE